MSRFIIKMLGQEESSCRCCVLPDLENISRTGEVAQLVKCSGPKHGDLIFISRNIKRQIGSMVKAGELAQQFRALAI